MEHIKEIYNMLLGAIVEQSYLTVHSYVKNVLKKALKTTKKDIEESLVEHFIFINNWSKEISFKDLRKPKSLNDVYIQLDMHLLPKRLHISNKESEQTLSIEEVLEQNANHLIVLGHPGAGKTTTMKRICQSILFEESFLPNHSYVPVVIRIRDLNTYKNTFSIYRMLFSIFALKISEFTTQNDSDGNDFFIYEEFMIKETVVRFLNSSKFLVVLDGYDEIPNIEYKAKITDEIRELFLKVSNSKFILTSRSSDLDTYKIDNSEVFEICPLTKNQIKQFTFKWFADEFIADNFLREMKNSPFNDALIRPLFLSHLCAIYERVGYIPEKPSSVYEKIIGLLLKEWDEQRSIKRTTKYSGFEIDRKERFLAHLASGLTIHKQKTVFTPSDLHSIYRSINEQYKLPSNQVEEVTKELESHTGIFVKTSWNEYSFSHKSLQEYLTAKHLVGLPYIPSNRDAIYGIPNEMAIVIALSTNPNVYFCELILKSLRRDDLNLDFIKVFLDRLLIEKPDFVYNRNLGLAYAHLLTKFILSKKYDISVIEEIFDEHMEQSNIKKSITKILSNYKSIPEKKSTKMFIKYKLWNYDDSFNSDNDYNLDPILCILKKYK